MAKKRDEQHRYGQHYTPENVARLLAAFAVRRADDLVFDPSCGDGRLLREALRLKEKLAPRRGKTTLARQLFGIDRSAAAIETAGRTSAQVTCADLFNFAPGMRLNGTFALPPQVDAIIGNPPYIRQEVMGAGDKRRIRERISRDKIEAPEIFWPDWSGRSDIYVYFFAHATRFLKQSGRLVYLTASSWLDVDYGLALREFLLRNYRIIAVIESAAESFFDNASINTAITVLAREPDAQARDANPARFVLLTETLSKTLDRNGDPLNFVRSIESTDSTAILDTHRIRVVRQGDLLAETTASGGKSGWGKYLRAADVFFRISEQGGARLRRLADIARVRFGVKTGANSFFYLKNAEGEKAKNKLISLGDVARVRRGLTTGANEFFYLRAAENSPSQISNLKSVITVADGSGRQHLIESKFLVPVVFSLKEIPGVLLDPNHTHRLFFHCPVAPSQLKGTKVLNYIRNGERAGYHLRPSCASRDPWYAVARGIEPAPLIFPSKVGERWLVALNRARVFEDKKLYGIFPRQGVDEIVLASLLNSTWARYYAEVTCRQMTGAQAIADIDVAVAERILLPDPRELSPAIRKNLRAAFDALARRPVLSIFEEMKRTDRRRLDDLTLTAIGFTDRSEREVLLNQLYAAVTEIVRDRLSRSRK